MPPVIYLIIKICSFWNFSQQFGNIEVDQDDKKVPYSLNEIGFPYGLRRFS